MPRVGFEPTIPAFERAKTVHALDRTTTVIGSNIIGLKIYVNGYFATLHQVISLCSVERYVVTLYIYNQLI
jgi:hypothetical protein